MKKPKKPSRRRANAREKAERIAMAAGVVRHYARLCAPFPPTPPPDLEAHILAYADRLEERAKKIPEGSPVHGGPFDGCPAFDVEMLRVRSIRSAVVNGKATLARSAQLRGKKVP